MREIYEKTTNQIFYIIGKIKKRLPEKVYEIEAFKHLWKVMKYIWKTVRLQWSEAICIKFTKP